VLGYIFALLVYVLVILCVVVEFFRYGPFLFGCQMQLNCEAT